MANKKKNHIWLVIIAAFLLMFVIYVFSNKKTHDDSIKYESFSDFEGATIGTQTGTVFDKYVEKVIKNPVFQYYDDISSQLLALKQGRVDAVALDEPVAKLAVAENSDLAVFQNVVQTDIYGYVLPKNSELTDQFSVIISQFKNDGTIDQLAQKWFSGNREIMQVNMDEYSNYDTSNGTIRFFHDSTQIPMSYVDSKTASSGYEVDLLLKIAKELNKKVELTQTNFSSLITAVSTGKADVAAGCISITSERLELVDFPESHYEGGIVLLCRRADIGAVIVPDESDNLTFFEKISNSFYRTLVKEDRYKLILSGLGVTVLISVLALVFGSVLGFGMCLLRRSNNQRISKITASFIQIIQGIPLVVLLLFLYYVVFASADFSGSIVAVIAFTINFAVNSAEIMRAGIDSISKSQWDVSKSLGFSKSQMFSKIIMPQAIVHFLPSFKGEFINMMKMTSVVGYIAVTDLTKASDIIRSHTYEALFPLFIVALLYSFLAWALTRLIGLIEIQIKPNRRITKDIPVQNSFESFHTANPDTSYFGKEIIRMEHLKKEYSEVTPLTDINASIFGGETVTIIGPSGCGKTTLLKMINRFQTPTEGKIFVFGKDISNTDECEEVQKKIGMIFQSYDLFPHLSVLENIMLAPMVVLKKSKQEAYATAMELLKTVSLANKCNAMPNDLSGGQKQRVAIAQALAMEPEIILFDEPTSALDPAMVSEVMSVMRNLALHKLTLVIVTHEMRFAKAVSSRILYLDEGTVYESGTPTEIFDHPQREKTRRFIQRLQVFEESITSSDVDFIGINTKLESFGRKNMLPRKTIYNMQTIFEELCVQLIMPKLSDTPVLTITTEYSEENESIRMMIHYNGKSFDPTDEADAISMQLIKNASQSISYRFLSKGENKNEIEIVVK